MSAIGWPQWIWIIFHAFLGGFILSKHGTPHEGRYDFGWFLIVNAGELALLYFGGFFS